MAIAFVRAAGNASVAVGTTLAVTISPTAGDTLVVVTEILATTAVASVVDNATGGSSTYTKQASIVGATNDTEIWTTGAGGIKSGVTTITITFGTTGVESGTAL